MVMISGSHCWPLALMHVHCRLTCGSWLKLTRVPQHLSKHCETTWQWKKPHMTSRYAAGINHVCCRSITCQHLAGCLAAFNHSLGALQSTSTQPVHHSVPQAVFSCNRAVTTNMRPIGVSDTVVHRLCGIGCKAQQAYLTQHWPLCHRSRRSGEPWLLSRASFSRRSCSWLLKPGDQSPVTSTSTGRHLETKQHCNNPQHTCCRQPRGASHQAECYNTWPTQLHTKAGMVPLASSSLKFG